MRRLALAAAILALAAGAAQARGHGFHGAHIKTPHSGKAPGESHRHRRASEGEVGTVGPSHFHPVKRWKGFSYLQHEKHPEKDD